MVGSVIVSYARTPIGRFGGALAPLSGAALGALAIAAAIERAGIGPEVVDHVVMGQVLQAGQGQITARQAAVAAGIKMDVPALTVNKVCLSGLQALYLADQLIRSGDAQVVVAGGMESMTNAPHLLPGARSGFRLGDARLVDALIQDGLWCAFDGIHMGAGAERDSAGAGIGRAAQDSYAAQSHERATAAVKAGRLAEEIVSVEVAPAKGAPILVEADEGIRPGTTAERLSTLAPAFASAGAVTAGNASQISDGAAALVVTSRETAERLGAEPLAELVGYGMVAGPGTSLLTQPSGAIARALERSGREILDIDLFELNEAFAAVVLASMAALGVGPEVVNVNGGAIALGHPIGASGARLAGTLITELKRRGGGLGAAALCGGGGQGDAALLRVA